MPAPESPRFIPVRRLKGGANGATMVPKPHTPGSLPAIVGHFAIITIGCYRPIMIFHHLLIIADYCNNNMHQKTTHPTVHRATSFLFLILSHHGSRWLFLLNSEPQPILTNRRGLMDSGSSAVFFRHGCGEESADLRLDCLSSPVLLVAVWLCWLYQQLGFAVAYGWLLQLSLLLS